MTTRAGFTLFEAVVALTIIALVAVATLATVGGQLRATDHAKHTTEAVSLAEDRMAAVRLLTAGDLRSLPDSLASGRFPPPLDMYTWQVVVAPIRDVEGLAVVAVHVGWPDGAYTLSSRVYHAPPLMQMNRGGQSTDQGGGVPFGDGGTFVVGGLQ